MSRAPSDRGLAPEASRPARGPAPETSRVPSSRPARGPAPEAHPGSETSRAVRGPAPETSRSPRPARADASSSGEDARRWPAARKLEYLRARSIGDCQRCPLSRTRTKIVFGVGNPEADLMFVGEAPGADEDRQGVPFVGRAGQRLTAFLDELSLPREQVYIANVLKCRPPGNRDPQPNEVAECSRFLEAQIRAIQPRVLIALGRHAASLLLRRQNLTLRNLRGRTWKYEQAKGNVAIPLIVTYHPSFVLRREGDDARRGVKRHGPSEVHEAVMTDLREALRISRASPR